MSQTRNEITEENELTPLREHVLQDVIQEIILPYVGMDEGEGKPIETALVDEAADFSLPKTKMINTFYNTCTHWRGLFQATRDERVPKHLLSMILQGGNDETIINIAKTNPALFFIKSTALDVAMDLDGNRRTIKDWSGYQAIFGTGNVELLEKVKPFLDAYLEKLPFGRELAIEQEQEKFPEGFDFPPCTDEFNQLINTLVIAISEDQQLRGNWQNPNPATLDALANLKRYLKPGIVQTGHHYNMNDFIKIHEIFDLNFDPWSWEQLAFFQINVMGIQERLMTAPYLAVVCTGLDNYMNKKMPLKQNFEVKNYARGGNTMSVLPYKKEDPLFRLGEHFFLDSYYGGCWASAAWAGATRAWKNFSITHSKAFATYAYTKEATVFDVRNCLR